MYIWTDENGVKHYSNKPPPKKVKNVREEIEHKTNEQAYRRYLEQTEKFQNEIAAERMRDLKVKARQAAEKAKQAADSSHYNSGYNNAMEGEDPQLNTYHYLRGYQDGLNERGKDIQDSSHTGSSGGIVKDPGPCIGACGAEQGICISQCQGNGQCIGNCAAAHGRCVARCHQ